MKKATMIGYVTLALSVSVLTSIEYAVADQADETTRQCLEEVRETMIREGIKQLYTGDQKRVNESCEQGDVSSAIRFVEQIGAYKRCVRDLDAYIKNNNLDVTKNVHNRAKSQCRRGDLRRAIVEAREAQTKIPATPAEIIEFVANTDIAVKGSSVTLSWRTANANTVMLGSQGANDFKKVQASGSRLVSPDKTTTYVLMVGQSTKGPTAMTSKTLRIAVGIPPKGTCSIKGELEGKWRQPIQELPGGPSEIWTVGVGIYNVGSDNPLEGASVSDRGIYRFKDLSAGKEYTVRPSWDSSPREGNVLCTPDKTHKGPKFNITGGPRID
jgi:hypothetical protein